MDEDIDPFAEPAESTPAAAPAAPFPAAVAEVEEDPFAIAAEEPATSDEPAINHFIEWSKKHREAMRAKDEEAASARAAMREKAEEELEEFYAQRTNSTATRSASNRKDEQSFLLLSRLPRRTRTTLSSGYARSLI